MKVQYATVLLVCVFSLMLLGIVMVYSSSSITAASTFGDSTFYLKKQLAYFILGIVALIIAFRIDTSFYQKYALPIFFVVLGLLSLTLVPGVGKSVGGASRWIPLLGLRFQPSEFFKIALAIYLAAALANPKSKITSFSLGMLPHLLLLGLGMVLILMQPDFGTTFLVATIVFTLLFVGGAKIVYLLMALIISLPVLFKVIASSPYRLERLLAFLEPWTRRENEGYQIVESLIAFGSGGVFGLGLGSGPGKLHFLPAAHTDFILSIIGEELGFIGISFVMICFLTIAVCGFFVALKSSNPFQNYLALSLTALLIFQFILNAFVVMGLVPTKGITLPFISSGGTSLVVCCFMAGIIIKIANESKT